MKKELLTLADKIKTLREQAGLTQAEVARQLGISRAGVNAWEMGLSLPSTERCFLWLPLSDLNRGHPD